jgi:UPF0176 protein
MNYSWTSNTEYTVILFYLYVELDDVDHYVDIFTRECQERHLLGRILLANEGINGTLSGSALGIRNFVYFIENNEKFQVFKNIDWKYSTGIGASLPFFDLFIKHSKELISSGESRDFIKNHVQFDSTSPGGLAGTGIHLSPQEFHNAIQNENHSNKDKGAILIDVRNEMEYAIGRFDNAIGLGA